uniref:Uncharacterized protein n=1 Tax=Cannabis sativa TaxID=3483 RepID=A0A803R3E7_CANSA
MEEGKGPVRVRCQRIGCDATFSEDDNPEGSCQYHDSVFSLQSIRFLFFFIFSILFHQIISCLQRLFLLSFSYTQLKYMVVFDLLSIKILIFVLYLNLIAMATPIFCF